MYRHSCNLAALGLALAAVYAGLRPAEAQTGASRTLNRPIEISVKTVSDDGLRGEFVSFSPDDGLLLRTDSSNERRIPAADVVRLSTTTEATGRSPSDWEIRFADGSTLYGRVVGSDEESLTVETIDLGRLTAPLDRINWLISPVAFGPTHEAAYRWFERGENFREDAALLTNGDTARGFVVAVNPDVLSMDSGGRQLEIPTRLVVAVRFAGAPMIADQSDPAVRATVSFEHSGRLSATRWQWTGPSGSLTFGAQSTVTFASDRVVRVDMEGGRWEWLSAHRPISQQHTPMLTLPWDPGKNRNVVGRPLSVAGETFAHGIGVHSRSRLTFDLQGAYREFVTYFGIDDDSGPYADVTVLVRVDDKPRFEQTGVTRGRLHGPIRLDVTRANRIELFVDFGLNGDIQDRFNWIEPALIR